MPAPGIPGPGAIGVIGAGPDGSAACVPPTGGNGEAALGGGNGDDCAGADAAAGADGTLTGGNGEAALDDWLGSGAGKAPWAAAGIALIPIPETKLQRVRRMGMGRENKLASGAGR